MNLIFITSSDNKFNELAKTLGESYQLERKEIDLQEIQSLDPQEIIEEKLRLAIEMIPKRTLIVEDTSFEIEALNGLPGTLIKFFEKAVDDSGIYKIARAMQPSGKLIARAKVVLGLLHENDIKFFDGIIDGQIVEMIDEGWGFDRIFIPEGYDKPMGVLGTGVKTKISHRAQATNKLKKYLEELHN